MTDSSEEKSRNDIKIHKEEIPGSISGLADGDDSVTVSISQPKSLNLNPSKLPETNRKEDRDVTMQKGVVTPKPGATRKDKCLPAKDPVTILDSDKKKTAPAKKKPLPSIKQKIKQPQDKPPPGSVDTSNSISKSQSKQRRRPSQENESKQPAHKSKPQVSERRKSATASSRSAVEPKHAKIMASGSRQPTSKRPAEDRKLDVKAADGRKSRLDSHQRDRSDDKIIISTEEPILSAAQRDLLPAFKVTLVFCEPCLKCMAGCAKGCRISMESFYRFQLRLMRKVQYSTPSFSIINRRVVAVFVVTVGI